METPDIVIELLGWMLMLSPWVVIPSWFLKRWALQGIGGKWGVRHAWLVWIPGVHAYTPGAIADRYRTTVKGREKSRRKIWLPLLRIASTLLWIPAIKLIAEGYIQYEEIVSIGASEIAAEMMFGYAVMDSLVYLLPALILGIIGTVLNWVVLYEIYAACEPSKRWMYFVLSMIPAVSLITQPLFLMLCRERGQALSAAEEGR